MRLVSRQAFIHDELRICASVNSWIARIEHHLQCYQRIRKGSSHHETLPVGAAEANIVSATNSGHKNLGGVGQQAADIGAPVKAGGKFCWADQKFRPNFAYPTTSPLHFLPWAGPQRIVRAVQSQQTAATLMRREEKNAIGSRDKRPNYRGRGGRCERQRNLNNLGNLDDTTVSTESREV